MGFLRRLQVDFCIPPDVHGLQGHCGLMMDCTMGFRGILVLLPGAPPCPPSPLTLVFVELFISQTLTLLFSENNYFCIISFTFLLKIQDRLKCSRQKWAWLGLGGFSIQPHIIFQRWRNSSLLGRVVWQREQSGPVRGFPWGISNSVWIHPPFFLFTLSFALFLLLFIVLFHCCFRYIVFISTTDFYLLCLQFFSSAHCSRRVRGGRMIEWHMVWSVSVGS